MPADPAPSLNQHTLAQGSQHHRTPYANKGRIILNLRDEWLMPIVAEQGGMRYDQLGRWFAFYPE